MCTEVKSWLKTLRLHKYCEHFENMNYQEMVNLTSEDLLRLGDGYVSGGRLLMPDRC